MSSSEDPERYEVVVVGGGPAGQMAAMYSTRLGHRTALVDRGGGRAAMMQEVHNMIGIPEEVSGNELLATGRDDTTSKMSATGSRVDERVRCPRRRRRHREQRRCCGRRCRTRYGAGREGATASNSTSTRR